MSGGERERERLNKLQTNVINTSLQACFNSNKIICYYIYYYYNSDAIKKNENEMNKNENETIFRAQWSPLY